MDEKWELCISSLSPCLPCSGIIILISTFFPLKPLQSLCASVSQGRNIDPLLRAGLRLIDLLVQHPEQSSAVEEAPVIPLH